MRSYKNYFIIGTNRDALQDTFNGEAIGTLIRCRDCKHYMQDDWAVINGKPVIIAHHICGYWGGGWNTDPDGWCFRGKRKEGGHNAELD